MFKGVYQGGDHVMVLSAQGKEPTSHCKLTGSISRRYDKGIRGYVHVLEGDSITTRIQLPGNSKTTLGLIQPFLVLQVAVQQDARFTVELCLQDCNGGRRRILFSSSVREPVISPLIARVPLISMATGQWCNVCFNLPSLVAELFPNHAHKSLESLEVGGACLLRRVFTMRERPSTGVGGDSEIPSACQMIVNHTPIPTQVVSSVYNDKKSSADSRPVRKTGPKSSGDQAPTHVAFGKKVAIPQHILSRQKPAQVTSRNAGNTRRKDCSSDLSLQQTSAPRSVRGGVVTTERAGLDGCGHKETQGAQQGTGRGRGERGGHRAPGKELVGKEVESQRNDELLVLGVARRGDLLGAGRSASTPELRAGREEGDSVEEGETCLFSYFSPPRSAGTSCSPTTAGSGSRGNARGVDLDQDFLLHNMTTADGNDQELPRESDGLDEEGLPLDDTDDVIEGIPLVDTDLNQTRLSDDYDWRQYASREDTTPLPSHSSPHSPPAHPSHPHTGHHDNNTEIEDTATLSDSITTGKLAATHSLLDSLDTRSMGGALSPEPLNQSDLVLDQSNQSDEELELVYDPQLKCFFDPKTHKYYELVQ